MHYQAYQAHTDLLEPLRALARIACVWLDEPRYQIYDEASTRRLSAACQVFALAQLTHRRPDYGIDLVEIDGVPVPVSEEAVMVEPFGTLLRFRKAGAMPQPRVLLVAPMSGHFATLLRDTVRTMLRDHDVYITDWHNARDVPLSAGRFDFDDYVDYLMRFMRELGPGAHLVAVCQPCVAALAAAALMADDDDPAQPASITLMAGPVDASINPTRVNELATGHSIEWFEQRMIGTVPMRLRGGGRRVYPGYLQLAAFMSMNMERHLHSFKLLYEQLVSGEYARAQATRMFYEEYFAVADLPAEFYLETVDRVFQRFELARGQLQWRGRRVDPAAIRRAALLTIEGEKDDICSVGQTLAAQDLCRSVRPYLRTHYVQTGVGHYGVFSGKRWSGQIYPLVRQVIHDAP
ncbi:MAG: polyhydroxyalkanoate depolymerase [Burkholderiales bacterium]|nr:polyhydroxyalkanoate depolymerase [Burkholderiales bacterium]